VSQLDMFSAAPVDEGNLVGLKVKLDRAVDREHPCCRNVCIINAGKGPHAGELHCADCGQHRGWLSQSTAQWIEHVVTRFGAPITPIVVRKLHFYEEEAPAATISTTDKRRQIEEINRLIVASGFTPKDFFLTQPPLPDRTDEAAYTFWKARERSRKTIAKRMALCGLTAHDLIQPICVTRKPLSATADVKSSTTAMQQKDTAMANIDDFYPSKFLRASDLKGKEIEVTIERVESEEFEQDGGKRNKPVVHFRSGGIKPLVANKTNSMLIATALGSKDYDTWSGKQVRLYPDMETFRGQVHEVIRVRRALPPPAEELNDEIPV